MTPGDAWAGWNPNPCSGFSSPRFPWFFLFGGGRFTPGSSSCSKSSPYKIFSIRKNFMGEDRPHLALDRPELTGVFFHAPGLPLIDGGLIIGQKFISRPLRSSTQSSENISFKKSLSGRFFNPAAGIPSHSGFFYCGPSSAIRFSRPTCFGTLQKGWLDMFGGAGNDVLEPGHESLLP